MKLDRMPAVMAALVVFALLQSAAIIVQTLLLSSVISSLWSGSAPDSQIAGIVGFLSCFALLRIVRFAQDAMLERYSLRQAQGLRQQLLSCIFDARVLLARKVGSPVAATTATEGIDQVQLRHLPAGAGGYFPPGLGERGHPRSHASRDHLVHDPPG